MWPRCTCGVLLLFACLLTSARGQSGEGEWGSGVEDAVTTNTTTSTTTSTTAAATATETSATATTMPTMPMTAGKSELTLTTNATATVTVNATSLLTSREVSDDPIRSGDARWPPPFFEAILLDKDGEKEEDKEEEEEGGECAVNFNTNPMWARQVKAYKDELAYLKAIQHGNQAVIENLVQFVGAEMGDQRYQDVIEENIAGVRQEYSSCGGVVDKTAEELQSQLEGQSGEALNGMQKIKEESLAFADMLSAAADIAGRLESTSKALHASLSQLKHARRGLNTPHH